MSYRVMPDDGILRLADGRSVEAWQGGDLEGRPVFFHHGTPDTRRAAWLGDEAARRAGIRLLAVNRPGYGASDPCDRPGRLLVADDVAEVADLLGVGRYGVVGMSVGGQYALACAAQHPERVTSAAVVASPAVVPDLDPPWHRDDLDESGQHFVRSLADGSPAENAERMRPDFERYCDNLALEETDTEVARRWLDGLPTEDAAVLGGQSPAEVAAGAREALAEPRGYLRDAAIAFCRWDFSLDAVTCPVTLWYGERDANAPVRHGVWLAEHLPNARLRVLAETGHLEALHGHWPEILAGLAD